MCFSCLYFSLVMWTVIQAILTSTQNINSHIKIRSHPCKTVKWLYARGKTEKVSHPCLWWRRWPQGGQRSLMDTAPSPPSSHNETHTRTHSLCAGRHFDPSGFRTAQISADSFQLSTCKIKLQRDTVVFFCVQHQVLILFLGGRRDCCRIVRGPQQYR